MVTDRSPTARTGARTPLHVNCLSILEGGPPGQLTKTDWWGPGKGVRVTMATNTIALGAGAAHSGTASPGSFVTDNRQWFDIMIEQEERVEARRLRMSAAEWKEEQTRMLRSWRGKDVRSCIAEIERIDRRRRAPPARPVPVVAPRPRTEFDVEFAIWKDMIEEPAKYGDDIVEWLALDEKLTRGPGRWRLAAYWTQVQAEEDAKEEALVAPWRKLYSQVAKEAAFAGERAWIRRDVKRIVNRVRNAVVTIQAAVRGHLARNKQPFRDCCMCLSHRTCPLKTDAGMMCRGCAEQGPYVDETGPLDDGWNWFRADYVDLTVRKPVVVETGLRMCHYCENTLPAGVHDYCDETCRNYHEDDQEFGIDNPEIARQHGQRTACHGQCRWCFCELEDGQPSGFCDRDCWNSYMKEASRYD